MKVIEKNNGILTIFEPGDKIGKGRIKGSKNKAKLASEVVELYFHSVFRNHPKIKDFIKEYPNVLNNATIEEVIYLVQASRAIFKEDTNAAQFIINRARGTKPEGSINDDKAINLPSAELIKEIASKLSKKF